MRPRNPEQVIADKREIPKLFTSLQFFGFRNNLSLGPVVPLGQFPPYGVESEFCQTRFSSDRIDGLLI